MTRTAFRSLRFQQWTFKDEASPENKKMATTFDLQWHQPKVTSIKRADGVEFIMHCVKYSWSTFSSIAYLLMNDKEISMRLSIYPYTNYNEVQLVSSCNPLFTWKTSAHTSFLRFVPLNVSTHYTIAGRGSIVSLKAQIHCTWKSKWNSGTDSQTTAPSLFQFTDNVHNFSAWRRPSTS